MSPDQERVSIRVFDNHLQTRIGVGVCFCVNVLQPIRDHAKVGDLSEDSFKNRLSMMYHLLSNINGPRKMYTLIHRPVCSIFL